MQVRENKNLEFKSAITNTFLKTVSAYSNFGNGEILFGVNDDGTICGIANPEQARLDIETRINDSISPKPDFELDIDSSNNVIKLIVNEGAHKPYLYKGKAYRRSDTASIEVDSVELGELVLEGKHIRFEELPYETDNLTFDIFADKLKEKLGVEELSQDIFRTLGLVTRDKSYNNAAALFADTNNFYGVDMARFGNSISEIMDRETVTGVSVLKQYEAAVNMIRRYYQYEEIKGIERTTVDLIPEAAYREAVANALLHRNWNVNVHVRISMFKDKIEINSPGGLPRGITEEEYLRGSFSCLRNPILGNVFFRMHYVEMFGTGIARIKDAYKNMVAKPIFNISDNVISVTLPIVQNSYEVTVDESRLLEILQQGNKLSSGEIAKHMGCSKAKVLRIIEVLKERGYIQSTGKGRGTRYHT